MSIYWRVLCEECEFIVRDLPTRKDAMQQGYGHVAGCSSEGDEYCFRVQGITNKVITDVTEVGRKPKVVKKRLTLDYVRDLIPDEEFTARDFARILGSSNAGRYWIDECLDADYIEQTNKFSRVEGPITELYIKTQYLRNLEEAEAELQ